MRGVAGSLKLQNPVIVKHAVPFHELEPTFEPAVEHRRRHVTHLLGGHRQRHERRKAFNSFEIDLLKTLFVPSRNIRRPTFSCRPLRLIECRQLHDFAGIGIYDRLIPCRAHTVSTN